MNKFNKQLEHNLNNDVSQFNTEPEFAGIRQLYEENYQQVFELIQSNGHKTTIEDIALLDRRFYLKVINNINLLK